MNLDRFNNMNVRKAAQASMHIINAIQQMPPEEQVAGMASTFLLLADHNRMTPQEMFAVVANIMNHADGRRPEFAAVAQYMENELK